MSAAAELVDDDFVRVCRVDELPEVGVAAADINGTIVAIVRTKSGDLHAVDDTCSHANVSLSEGEVYPEEREIECWKHGSTFSLVTGQPQSLPATKPVPVYAIELDGDDVMVRLP